MKMRKQVLTFSVLGALFLVSCKSAPQKQHPSQQQNHQQQQQNTALGRMESNTPVKEDVVSTSYTDSKGQVLKAAFNNTHGTVLLNFNRTPIRLVQKVSASGFWYVNDTYEFRGKGDKVTLTKDGVVVFEN